MSYTRHVWADGQSGANAAAWLNNAEEGVRAASEAADAAAEDYDASDADSVYSRAAALKTDAQVDASAAAGYYANAVKAQTEHAIRNSLLILKNGTATGAGTGIIINNYTRTLIGDFPYQYINTTYSFRITKPGYYMFLFNTQVLGPNASIKILKNGVFFERVKLIAFQDVGSAQEETTCSACIIRYVDENAIIHFTLDTDGTGAALYGWRCVIRRM